MPFTNDHLTLAPRDSQFLAGPLRLLDGSEWSIQAGSGRHLSSPRYGSLMTYYEAVEVEVLAGDAPASWEPWRVARDVKRYGWLPVELVDAEVRRRGERRYNGQVLAND